MANLDDISLEAVGNYNYKANAERATINADAHQNRIFALAEASLAQQLNKMNSLDPTEAAAVSKVTNSGLAEKMAQLSAAIASNQQFMKGAIMTPPQGT